LKLEANKSIIDCVAKNIKTVKKKYSNNDPTTGRKFIIWLFGITGLLAYNWWILAPFKTGIISSPNELFSDLEIDGRPYATVMQHLDLASGMLLLITFLVIGSRRNYFNFKEWLATVIFAVGGALGGIFSETCSDTTNAVCRHAEWTLRLPLHHYLHLIVGIVEFGAISVALYFAYQRTKGGKSLTAKIYKMLAKGAIVAYPLLGLAYVTNRFGAYIEPVFFASFTLIVILQISERLSKS